MSISLNALASLGSASFAQIAQRKLLVGDFGRAESVNNVTTVGDKGAENPRDIIGDKKALDRHAKPHPPSPTQIQTPQFAYIFSLMCAYTSTHTKSPNTAAVSLVRVFIFSSRYERLSMWTSHP